MAKYRGFENEINAPVSGLGQWAARNGGGGRGGFVGPRRVAVAAPRPPVVTVARPPAAGIPFDRGGVPVSIYGIPGDIRDISARSLPGEAIDVDPAGAVDDMTAENGVPGVDDSGGFPYGDPRGAEKAPTQIAGMNTGLIMAAIAAALFLL